jgi:hypothetical protein
MDGKKSKILPFLILGTGIDRLLSGRNPVIET